MPAGNSIATAQTVTLSTTVQNFSDSITSGAWDYYRIDATRPTFLNVTASSLSANADLRIIDGNYKVIRDLRSENTGTQTENINTILQAGTYYLEVRPAVGNSSTTNYSLAMSGTNDFDPSIGWRAQVNVSGSNQWWNMNGTSISDTDQLTTVNDANWRMVQTIDMNNDGWNDVLWENSSSNQLLIWYQQGSALKYGDYFTTSLNGNKVVGAGDFNGDGFNDIFLRNESTGANTLWYLDGTMRSNPLGIDTIQTVATNFKASGVGDFNNDGKADIVWRDTTDPNGSNSIWHMDSNKLLSGAYFSTVSDQNWKISGVGDYDKDGRKDDILWRNTSTGDNTFWYLTPSGSNYSYTGVYTTAVTDQNWKSSAGGEQVKILDTAGTGSSGALNIGSITASDKAIYSGQLGHANSADEYKFTLSGSGSYKFLVDTESQAAVKLELYTDAGQLLATISNSGSQDGLYNTTTASNALNANLGAGTYRLRTTIDSSSIAANPENIRYQVAINRDYNTFLGSVGLNSLSLSTTTTLPGNNRHQYSFEAKSAGLFQGTLSGLSADLDLILFTDKNSNSQPDQGEIVSSEWQRGTTSETISRFIDAGYYTVDVVGYNPAVGGNYSLTSSFSPASFQSSTEKQYLQLDFTGGGLGSFGTTFKSSFLKAASFWENAINQKTNMFTTNIHKINITGSDLGSPGSLAYASFNQSSTGQVNYGTMIVNNNSGYSSWFNDATTTYTIARHEMAHTMGFGTGMIWDTLKSNSTTYKSNSYAGFAYGDHLGTKVATSVPLTSTDHWNLSGTVDIMQPTTSFGASGYVSPITLGALRDLGYDVNMGSFG